MSKRRNRTLKRWMRAVGYNIEKLAPLDGVVETVRLLRPKAFEGNLIRVGGEGDGGYIVPDDLAGIGACFSPGVSTVADFEIDLKTRFGIPSFLADASVSGPPAGAEMMDFEKRFLGARNDAVFTRLQDWIARKEDAGSLGDLLLQMDIEGAEYDVIVDIPREVLDRFRILVIELHSLDMLFSRGGQKLLSLIFGKLTENHVPIHLHPNNCVQPEVFDGIGVPPVMEVTLLRKDRYRPGSKLGGFPNPLDRTNVPGNRDFALPHVWYRER